MRILITGGAGFIASHSAIALRKHGHKVTTIDNLDPYYPLKLKKYNLQRLKVHNIPFYKLDIRNSTALQRIFAKVKPEIVMHIAAKAGVRNSILHPEEYFSVNVDGTLNVLQAAKENRVKKVMIASSSSVYGNNKKVPFAENDPVENQISPYAASKRAMEILCKMYSQTYGLSVQIFRFFTVYGPSGRPDMAPAIFTKAIDNRKPIKIFGNLTTERDYTYIDDVVDGLIKALKIDDNFAIYNLGHNKPISLRKFISTIEKLLGKKAKLNPLPPQPGDVKRTWAAISKAKKRLRYNPKTSIKEGMSKFISWYKKHKDLYA